MNNWNYARDGPDPGWQGAMTVPRTLTFEHRADEVELRHQPADEVLETLESHSSPIADLHATTLGSETDPLAAVPRTRRPLEFETTIDPGTADEVGLRLRTDESHESVITYDADVAELRFDRTNADAFFGADGDGPDGYGTVSMALEPHANGSIELHALVDRCSVDLFANGGRRTMTNLVYPPSDRVKLALFATGGTATVERFAAAALEAPR